MLKKLQMFATRHKRILATLSVVAGLAVLLLAVSAWQNYSWVHRPLNRYEDELPLYGMVAVGKTARAPKDEMQRIISTADIIWDSSIKLEETRWYQDMMGQISPNISLTPEDMLIMGLYATNDEDRQDSVELYQNQTIVVDYSGGGGLSFGNGWSDESDWADEDR